MAQVGRDWAGQVLRVDAERVATCVPAPADTKLPFPFGIGTRSPGGTAPNLFFGLPWRLRS